MCQFCRRKCSNCCHKRSFRFVLLVTMLAFIIVWVDIFGHRKLIVQSSYHLAENFHLPLFVKKINKNSSFITVDDVCFTVKTSKRYHSDRVELILKTWFKKANGQVVFVTDFHDPIFLEKTGKQMVVTDCGNTHFRYDLCCKLATEFDIFISSSEQKKWWCHFDDDNYVNIERLLEVLNQYDWTDQVYIGRRSRPFAIKPWLRIHKQKFQFGTGGAGFCLTRSLANDMKPWCSKLLFSKTCFWIDCPDDCALGFVITNRLNVSLTESSLFHSHLESLGHLDLNALKDQVTLSYFKSNVIRLPSSQTAFSRPEDPTRLRSLHCLIYPHDQSCV